MKNNRLYKHLLAALVTLALASPASRAQTNLFIEPSYNDTGGSNSGTQSLVMFGSGIWQNCYADTFAADGGGITNYTLSFDTNNPPPYSPTGATNGSVKTTVGWDGTNAGGLVTFACFDNNFWDAPFFDATQYSAYDFDFKYDTNSTILPTNAAQFDIMIDLIPGAVSGSLNGVFLANFANSGVNAANFDGQWHHISIPIPITINPAPTRSKGPGYHIYNGAGTTNGFSFWQANLELIAREPCLCAPEALSFVPTVNGLNLWNDMAPNYSRHQVRTHTLGDFNVDWVGHATLGAPVTYKWNYAHAPTNSGAGVNFAITPDPASSATYADPEWSATNCFYLAINEVGGTSVVANITVKTNQASGTNTAVSISRLTNNTPSAVGVWSLTFTNDTDFVLTVPGGAHVAATIPASFLTTPYTGVSLFLSATANNDLNYGSYADITTFDVTGVVTPIHEDFTAETNLSTPFLMLQDQNHGTNPAAIPNILFVTTNDFMWLKWNLPDSGWTPQIRSDFESAVWTDSPFTNTVVFGTTRYTRIPTAYANSNTQSYFRLVK